MLIIRRYEKILLLFISLQSLTTYAQDYFEGKIVYANIFESKLPNISNDQMRMLIGAKQDYFIKGGYYKSYTNGHSITVQLYDAKRNRLYNKTAQSDTLYWFDASVNTDEVLNYDLIKNKERILNNDCDALIINTKNGKTVFYYSSKYPVDVSLYKQHNYGNWFYFLAKAKALPLKIVVENNQFKMESTAIELKHMKLKDDFFEISKDIPIKKY